jgi:hypothetical protein
MTIQTDQQLDEKLRQAGNLLQEIQDYVKRDFSKPAKVRFPRGFIRTADVARQRLRFLEESNFKRNASYTMLLADVQHWLLVRTDLSGTVKEMLIKQQFFLLGTLIESLTKVFLDSVVGKKRSYGHRTEYMAQHGIITAELCASLDWIWEIRNNMHLFLVEDIEWASADYTVANHNLAVKAFKEMLDAMNEWAWE